MTRPASLIALVTVLLGALTARATAIRPGGRTLALGKTLALRAHHTARPTLAGVHADYGRHPRA